MQRSWTYRPVQFGQHTVYVIECSGRRVDYMGGFGEPDATLIAAAPTLLAACESAIAWCSANPHIAEHLTFMPLMRVAVERAKVYETPKPGEYKWVKLI